MGKKIALGVVAVLVLLLGGLLAAAAGQPDDFKVERSREIAATPEVLWANVADFSKWPAWSPWSKLDPEQKIVVTGDAATVGHKSAWTGDKAGQGEMTVNKADAPKELAIDLHFIKPFEAQNLATFTFAPAGDKTKVVWTMTGKKNLMSKAVGLLKDMDAMIGKDFEAGLAGLDQIVTAK